jgi:[acyl-carrier-protein] S-malonyltransferase
MTKSVTLLFPGQGSQYIGMGQLLEGHQSFELLQKANQILDFDLSKIMLEGPIEKLTLTENTQPAILTYSVGLFNKLQEILKQKDIKIDRVLGHSVGEYAALVAAGVLSFEDGVKAVNLRGKFMQEAVPAGVGSMHAIMKVDGEFITKACKEVSTEDSKVMPANFNEPNQIVISGEKSACDRAIKYIEENFEGKFRSVELNVSAPFHSSLMKPAADKLLSEFNSFTFNENKIPYIANIDAKEYGVSTKTEIIKDNLYKQVDGSVLWTQSIESLPTETICIEVGPGKILKGLLRKINRDIKVVSLDNEAAFDELNEVINEG